MENQEMKIRKLSFCAAAFMAAAALSGCSSMQDFHQNLVRSLRTPGETMVVNPEETALFHQCPEGRQDAPALLETDTIPNRVKPGEEINHRIRYVLCRADQSTALSGEIVRTVSYEGKSVFSDSTAYDFKPGIWTVDAFVSIPENATPGIYKVNTALVYKGGSSKKSNTFQVKNLKEDK